MREEISSDHEAPFMCYQGKWWGVESKQAGQYTILCWQVPMMKQEAWDVCECGQVGRAIKVGAWCHMLALC